MTQKPNPFFKMRPKPDGKAFVEVTFQSDLAAYMTVDKRSLARGEAWLLEIAREKQARGELPTGTIRAVKPVR